jgi:hypothetical protein
MAPTPAMMIAALLSFIFQKRKKTGNGEFWLNFFD